MELRLEVGWKADVAVVGCRGRIVFGQEVDELRVTVLSLLKKTNRVVLLLPGIERIDSEGLAALVSLFISARNRRGELKLAELSRQCREALRVTKLAKVFEVYDTEDRAIASFHTEKPAGAKVGPEDETLF